MIESFSSFSGVFFGISELLFIIAAGFALSWIRVIGEKGAQVLTRGLIWVCLPALILSRVTEFFAPADFHQWWVLPIGAAVMSIVGFMLGWVVHRMYPGFSVWREFSSTVAFQNCGYVPMSLIVFTVSGAVQEQLLIYIFLFLIGFNLCIWFLLPLLFSSGRRRVSNLFSVVNPPFIANVIAFSSVFIVGNGWIPDRVVAVLRGVGNVSFPLSLVLVGAALHRYKGFSIDQIRAVSASVLAKLVLLPVIVGAVLYCVPLDPIHRFIFFLEAGMPVAVTILIISQGTRVNNTFISGAIFYSHVCSIITIPVWMMVYAWIF